MSCPFKFRRTISLNVEYFHHIGNRIDNLFDMLPKEQQAKYEKWYREEFRAKHVYVNDNSPIDRVVNTTMEEIRCMMTDLDENDIETRRLFNLFLIELKSSHKQKLICDIIDMLTISSFECCNNCSDCKEKPECRLGKIRDGVSNIFGIEFIK